MIVQSAAENSPHMVITQPDHAVMSGDFAQAFGNEMFAGLDPEGPMVFVAGHHDDGWAQIDAKVEQAASGLPHHLTQTPLPYLLITSEGSPSANEAFHPLSGIISSMHTYGLFNGRYGLSDRIVIDLFSAEQRPPVEAMLDVELARQARLKKQLSDEGKAEWVTEEFLFHNYKLLQFFDTLALYFHMAHAEAREEAEFLNVPKGVADDVTVTIRPVGAGSYSLAPFPFKESGQTFRYQGRMMRPQPAGIDLKALWQTIDPTWEEVTLVAG